MMNRPRPRKIINVIKTTSSPSPASEIEDKVHEEPVKFVQQPETTQTNNTNTIKPAIKPVSTINMRTASPEILNSFKPSISNTSDSVNPSNFNSTNFVTRKPTVATLKKAHVPPPPTFSDSPKSSPISHKKTGQPKQFDCNSESCNTKNVESFNADNSESLNNNNFVSSHFCEPKTTSLSSYEPIASSKNPIFLQSKPEVRKTSPPVYPSYNDRALSPRSSGEAFLDAADKAADFISGALLNSFKGFNLSDTSSVKMSSPSQTNTARSSQDDDPFADIMKKLKSSSKPEATSPNLMDEEPPESFNLDNEDAEINECDSKSFELENTKKDYPSLLSDVVVSSSEPIEREFIENMYEDDVDHVKPTEPFEYSETTVENVYSVQHVDHFESNTTIALDETSDYFEQKTLSDCTLSSIDVSESIVSSVPSLISCAINENSKSVNSNSATSASNSTSVSSTIPFFDSLASVSSDTSLPNSSISPVARTTGFRASILKHGLSALEKIGKSTADVVVSTRNKLSEPSFIGNTPITPDYSDESASFIDIFKIYGGHSKLQELQIKGIRASISMKLTRVSADKMISFDYQKRLKIRREIAEILHPDRIMDNVDEGKILLFDSTEVNFPLLFEKFSDEIYCVQKLLKSLDNILIIKTEWESLLISSNRRRHVICQISTVLATILLTTTTISIQVDPIKKANEICFLSAQIIKCLQTNFVRNCEGYPCADRDQQVAIKLILDLSYSIVPQLQQF